MSAVRTHATARLAMYELELIDDAGLVPGSWHIFKPQLEELTLEGIAARHAARWPAVRADRTGTHRVSDRVLAGRLLRAKGKLPMKRGSLQVSLTGRRYGWLVVGPYAGRGVWQCRCDCGAWKAIPGRRLRDGDAKSCGCQARGAARARRGAASVAAEANEMAEMLARWTARRPNREDD